MKKRTLLVLLLAFALVFPSCGQKKQSQSKLTGQANRSAANINSQNQNNTSNTQSISALHEDLMARMAALGIPSPTRPTL